MELVHLTDPHFGCEDKHALKAAERFIAERKPDAVIVSGDISREGLSSELEAAFAWFGQLASPVLVTPGNHDVPYHGLIGRLWRPFRRFERAHTFATPGRVRLDAWHTDEWSVVPVNTARGIQPRMNWAHGAISPGQTQRAVAELNKAKPGSLRIFVCHHPLDWPADAPIKGRTWGGRKAQPALMDAGARLFLSGHLHFASSRLVGRRALSVTSGTLSQRLRHEPCAFTAIRRPEPCVIETEIVHIVQGVPETAAVRRWDIEPYGAIEPEHSSVGRGALAGPVGALSGENAADVAGLRRSGSS